ncbi:hypothetical protein, partial [Streptomyces roseolus]|uniref:hypothetical protein n=1 Tax=Streptomyces roseolus TaxID=67358 RepID=UPI003655A21F
RAVRPGALAETIVKQRYRTMLRAGAIEALAQVQARLEAVEAGTEQHADLIKIRDHWAELLSLETDALTEGQVETTLRELRENVLDRAIALNDLADVSQVVRALQATGPDARVAEGEIRRYTAHIDGQRVPIMMIADGDGGWRIQLGSPLPAPGVPHPETVDPVLERRLHQLRTMLGTHGTGRPIQYMLGSGNNSDLYMAFAAEIQLLLMGIDPSHVAEVDWDPAFFALQANKLWSGREHFIAMLTGNYPASPQIGEPLAPEPTAPDQRAGLDNDVVPPVPDATVQGPATSAEMALRAWNLAEAIAARKDAGIALYRGADQIALPMTDLSPDSV